ncbi:hypothetical protein [Embleya sp. AB8]|uniref:hypothetical protein n=1 Tax=Embleya sp. AB8 TaxID=3156304 RepID=UPI003C7256A8
MLTTTLRRAASAAVAVAAATTLSTLTAAPAHADVRSNCRDTICFAADIYGRNVKDATVSTNDGRPASLHIFVAGRDWRSPGPATSFRTNINESFSWGVWVCGEGWSADGHLIGRSCVQI